VLAALEVDDRDQDLARSGRAGGGHPAVHGHLALEQERLGPLAVPGEVGGGFVRLEGRLVAVHLVDEGAIRVGAVPHHVELQAARLVRAAVAGVLLEQGQEFVHPARHDFELGQHDERLVSRHGSPPR
jgi:hypothetical protein